MSGSHRHDATHSGIRTSLLSTSPHGLASQIFKNAPLPPYFYEESRRTLRSLIHSVGGMLEPRYVVGATVLDQ